MLGRPESTTRRRMPSRRRYPPAHWLILSATLRHPPDDVKRRLRDKRSRRSPPSSRSSCRLAGPRLEARSATPALRPGGREDRRKVCRRSRGANNCSRGDACADSDELSARRIDDPSCRSQQRSGSMAKYAFTRRRRSGSGTSWSDWPERQTLQESERILKHACVYSVSAVGRPPGP